jgi:uncharacterized membrane protein YqhA
VVIIVKIQENPLFVSEIRTQKRQEKIGKLQKNGLSSWIKLIPEHGIERY